MAQKIPITEKALFLRLSRVLLKEDKVILKKCRTGSEEFASMGEYYTLNPYTNAVEYKDITCWIGQQNWVCLRIPKNLPQINVRI